MFSLSAAIPLATTGTFFHLPSILSWLIPVIILFETLSSTFVQGSYASLPPFFFHSCSFTFICVIFDYLTHYNNKEKEAPLGKD